MFSCYSTWRDILFRFFWIEIELTTQLKVFDYSVLEILFPKEQKENKQLNTFLNTSPIERLYFSSRRPWVKRLRSSKWTLSRSSRDQMDKKYSTQTLDNVINKVNICRILRSWISSVITDKSNFRFQSKIVFLRHFLSLLRLFPAHVDIYTPVRIQIPKRGYRRR